MMSGISSSGWGDFRMKDHNNMPWITGSQNSARIAPTSLASEAISSRLTYLAVPFPPELNLLTRPPDPSKHNEKKAIDVIAIHGINGHSTFTWKAADDIVWIRDFLRKDVRGARVFTYSFDSQTIFARSQELLHKIAKDLLNEILEVRTNVPPSRPLIFICHGMGGLIVEESLLQAQLNESQYLALKDCFKSVLFLSTPQRNSDTMPWSTLLNDVAKASFTCGLESDVKRRDDLLEALDRDCQTLRTVPCKFIKHVTGIKIFSFYELMPTPPQSECSINELTGSLGIAGEEIIPMAGCDHRSIACFSSREDKNYCLIVKKIKRLIKYGGEPTAIMLDNVNTLQSEQQTRKKEPKLHKPSRTQTLGEARELLKEHRPEVESSLSDTALMKANSSQGVSNKQIGTLPVLVAGNTHPSLRMPAYSTSSATSAALPQGYIPPELSIPRRATPSQRNTKANQRYALKIDSRLPTREFTKSFTPFSVSNELGKVSATKAQSAYLVSDKPHSRYRAYSSNNAMERPKYGKTNTSPLDGSSATSTTLGHGFPIASGAPTMLLPRNNSSFDSAQGPKLQIMRPSDQLSIGLDASPVSKAVQNSSGLIPGHVGDLITFPVAQKSAEPMPLPSINSRQKLKTSQPPSTQLQTYAQPLQKQPRMSLSSPIMTALEQENGTIRVNETHREEIPRAKSQKKIPLEQEVPWHHSRLLVEHINHQSRADNQVQSQGNVAHDTLEPKSGSEDQGHSHGLRQEFAPTNHEPSHFLNQSSSNELPHTGKLGDKVHRCLNSQDSRKSTPYEQGSESARHGSPAKKHVVSLAAGGIVGSGAAMSIVDNSMVGHLGQVGHEDTTGKNWNNNHGFGSDHFSRHPQVNVDQSPQVGGGDRYESRKSIDSNGESEHGTTQMDEDVNVHGATEGKEAANNDEEENGDAESEEEGCCDTCCSIM